MSSHTACESFNQQQGMLRSQLCPSSLNDGITAAQFLWVTHTQAGSRVVLPASPGTCISCAASAKWWAVSCMAVLSLLPDSLLAQSVREL